MNKRKTTPDTARNSKAWVRHLVGDSTNTGMRRFSANRNLLYPPRTRSGMRELEYATQRYADLYDFAPVGYVSFDRAGRIAEINLTGAGLFGMPRERMIGMPFAVFVWREDVPLFLHHLLRCRNSDARVETELRLKNSKHEIIQAQLCSTPITASAHNGAVVFQTSIVNLTQRKATEATLQEKEAELNLIVTQTPFMLTRCSRDLRYRYVSRAYAEMLGRKAEEISGKAIVEIMGKKGLATIWPYIERVLSGETVSYEALVPYRKERRFLHGVYMPDRNENGEVVGWLASLLDLTEQKRAEEALTESRERLRTIVDQANAGIARYDRHGRIKFANPRLCKMLSYSKSELQDKTVQQITHADDAEKTAEALHRVWTTGEPTELDKRYVRKDGSIIWVNVCDALERDAARRPRFIAAVAVDITVRKNMEDALQTSKGLLEELVQERTKDLHVANAELKREIEHRKGLEGEILAVSDREQQRLGQELHDGICQHLTAVAFMARSVALRLRNHRVIDAGDIDKIAELVNTAAADTRNLSLALHRSDVDAAGLVNALQDLVDREIWRTPCRLEVKPSFRINDDVTAAHLYRIAREAVINANKHAQARQILVKLERWRQGMILCVTDDGVGVSSESRLKQGLGFHIMDYRAQLMGGRLKIESPKHGGTCVSCYLPDSGLQSRKSKPGENGQLRRSSAKGARARSPLPM